MLIVQTTVPIDPDRREEALALITDLAEHSREEDGTVEYHATADLLDSRLIRFFECYEDEAAATAHTESAVYREFVTTLPDLVDGHLETVQFETDGPPTVHEFEAGAAIPDDA